MPEKSLMSYELVVNTRANIELLKAIEFLTDYASIQYANEFSVKVFQIFELICQNPFLFEKKSKFHHAPLKKFKYLVIYRVVEQSVIVTSIFHTSQNPTKKP